MHALKEILFKISKPVTARVKGLKNRHIGESCYIIGDGVSIKWFDLAAFPRKIAITLSYAPYHKQAGLLDLRYGLLTEPKYFYPYFRLPFPPKTLWRNRIQNKYRRLIKDYPEVDFFVNLSNYPVIRGSNIYFLFKYIDDADFDFLHECLAIGEGIYAGSFRCAIALAIYMGFKDITLVGCDYTHETARSHHWYEKGEGVMTPHPGYQRRFLEIAQKYATIRTVTLEGNGNVLPSITYTELTGKPLAFQENNELIDKETLRLLSTWPDYNMY